MAFYVYGELHGSKLPPPFDSAAVNFMASDDLDIPQIAVVGVPDDSDPSSSALALPSPSLDGSHLPSLSPADFHGFLSPPTPILRSARNSLDFGSPSHASDNSSLPPPPSPTLTARSSGSIRWANSTALRDNNPEEHDGSSSLFLAPPSQAHRRKGSVATVSSIASSSTERDVEDNSSIRLSTMRSAHSDVTSTLPSPTHTHVDANSDAGSRPSSVTSFFKRSVHRIRRPSPSPSGETDTGSETTRHDGQKGDNADVKRKEAQLARPAVLDLKQEADLDVRPFAFKPLQLASLVDPKNLETLEGMGGVDALLRGLGTHPTYGLSIETTTPPTHFASPDPIVQSLTASHTDDNPSKPDIMVTSPAGEPQGLQSVVSLGGSNTSLPTAFQSSEGAYKTSIDDRQRIFGHNVLPRRPIKSLIQLMWLALKDKVLVLLSICAVVSLALGLFQDFGQTRPDGEPPVDWVEGVAIIVAILIVVGVGSINDWQKEKQFEALNAKREERFIKVVRDDREQLLDVNNVVVGDVVLIEPGDIIPCDGIFLSGHNVRVDESSATGESDAIKKLSYQDCITLRDRRLEDFDPESPVGDGESTNGSRRNKLSGLDLLGHTDCFVVSGSKVVEGVGSYMVISVGTKSFNGRIMMALRRDSENTPLQLKLNDLAEVIAKAGSIAGGLLFFALLIRFFVELATKNPPRTPSEKGSLFVQILIISVTLVVVAVPEGLPLAVTLALAFATKRMAKENLLVRVLGSCETMANASVICTDKTGTLTRNEMTVVAGSIGIHAKFVQRLDENPARAGSEDKSHPNAKDFAIDLLNLNTVLTPQLAELINGSVAINSTAFEDTDSESGAAVFIGNKTETALLKFAQKFGWPNYKHIRDAANIVQMIPFSSDRKSMGCVLRLPHGVYRLFIKGASEILSQKCTRHVIVHRDGANEDQSGTGIETGQIGGLEEDNISRTITFYASQSLRTIALCYRDFISWPPKGMRPVDDGEVEYDDLATDLTLIGIIGIEDPLREGVREAVAKCKSAGVRVTMCTGDNVLTARSIALQCNIYTPGGIIMEGPHFRMLPPDIMKAIAPRLQVLARSSPEDKRNLVEMLKDRGDIIGVTGDGTNDGPALKTAHVGFSMGITGTEVAKEASDIILMDDNFSSIVKAIMWGRCVNDAVRKFLQFQINTNITAVVITFVTALAATSEQSALSAVQLLWINLIMDTFAALALATDQASEVLLDRKPDKKTDPLFTVDMIKQIIGQSTYLNIVIIIFHFLGSQILGFDDNNDSTLQKHQATVVQTLVFNAFVFAQIWNAFNSRRLDRKLNVFEGVTTNWYFIAITSIEVVAQVLICLVGGAAFQVTRMGGNEWAISLALGFVALPLGALIRLVPNEPCERIFVFLRLLPKPEVQPTMLPDAEPGFAFAVDRVRDNLSTFSKLRGGRMRASSFVRKSRSAAPNPDSPHLVSGLMAMVPTLLVASNWQPRVTGSLSDPAGFDPSRSSAALWENKFEVHPDTPRDDPVFRLLGAASRPLTPR